MKRTWRSAVAILVLPLVVLLSSCGRVHANVDIENENKIPVHLSVGVTLETVRAGKVPAGKNCDTVTPGENGIPKDAKLTPFEEDGYIGCNVDYVTTMAELNKGDQPVLQHDKQAGTWVFHMSADMAKQITDATGETSDPRQVSDFKMVVKFPGSVTSHSGSSTVSDGNTVTWTSAEEFFSPEGLKAEAKDSALAGAVGNPLLLGGVIGGVVLLGIIAVVAVVVTRRGRARTA